MGIHLLVNWRASKTNKLKPPIWLFHLQQYHKAKERGQVTTWKCHSLFLFLLWWHGLTPICQCQYASSSNCKKNDSCSQSICYKIVISCSPDSLAGRTWLSLHFCDYLTSSKCSVARRWHFEAAVLNLYQNADRCSTFPSRDPHLQTSNTVR